MAFVHCVIDGCNRCREVKPYGPAYYTFGHCYIHLQCEEVEVSSDNNVHEKKPRLTLPSIAGK
jgi:hypothetical protein